MATDNVIVATTIQDSSDIPQVETSSEFQSLFDTVNITSDRVNSIIDSIELLEDIIGLPLNRLNTEQNTSIVDSINKALDQRDLTSLIGDPEQLSTSDRRNVVSAINDLNSKKISRSDVSAFVLSLLNKNNAGEFAASIAPFSLNQITGLQQALDSKADLGALFNKEDKSSKGSPNGYAPLGADGKVPSANLPPIAVSDIFVANSQAEMLALSASKGDICIRNDNNRNYILQAEPATTLSNWVLLSSPQTGITSVAGKTGPSVTLAIGDITGLQSALDSKSQVDHTHVISTITGLQAALDSKAAASHTHSISQITGLADSLNNKFDKAGGNVLGPITGSGGSFTSSAWAAPYRLNQGSVIQWLKNGKTTSLGLLGDSNSFSFIKSDADDNSKTSQRLAILNTSGDFTATGNMTAYSDERLKTNIETIDNSLDIVKKLRGVRFTRRNTGRAEIGVIAQEINAVLPEVVFENDQDSQNLMSVAYGNIVSVLIEAVKDLSKEIDDLKSRL